MSKMCLVVRLFLSTSGLLMLLLCAVANDDKLINNRKAKHFLALLNQITKYRAGGPYVWQPFFYPSIIIFQSMNQEQNVNVIKSIADENYQENNDGIETLKNAKFVFNVTDTNKVNDITESDFSTNKSNDDRTGNETESYRQAVTSKDEMIVVTSENVTLTTVTPSYTETTLPNITTVPNEEKSSESNGSYPTPVYKNEIVNSLTFTTLLPYINIKITPSEKVKDLTESDLKNMTRFNRYANGTYYNKGVDQIEITTNNHENEQFLLPLSNDDRWKKFSNKGKTSTQSYNGFKPLAGLYYDGYLHRPLYKRQGFTPYHWYK